MWGSLGYIPRVGTVLRIVENVLPCALRVQHSPHAGMVFSVPEFNTGGER